MTDKKTFVITNDWLKRDYREAFKGKPPGTTWIKLDAGEGLRVLIRQDGVVTFVHRYSTRAGQREEYTLGNMTPRFGVPEARKVIRFEASKMVLDPTGWYSPKRDRAKVRSADSIPELIDEFLKARAQQASPLAQVTIDHYAGALRKHVLPAFAARNIYDPGLPNVFRDVLAGLTPGAKSFVFRVTRTFGNWVRKRLRLADNPFVGGFEDREKPAVRKRHGFFDADEIQALLRWLIDRISRPETPKARRSAAVGILILALTGMRNAEVRCSTWGMWDLDRRKVNLPRTKTGEEKKPFSRAAAMTIEWIKGHPCDISGRSPFRSDQLTDN